MINKLCLALGLGLGALLLADAPVSAQSGELPAELIEELTARARAALPMARLDDGSNVPPETEAERSQPIVPRPVEVRTIMRGILTAQTEACGLDWRGVSYLPYMQALRRRYHGKPIAYLGLLHGFAQGVTRQALADGFTCTDDMRARLTEAASRAMEVP